MICGSLLVLHASKQNIYLEMSSVHLTLHRSTHEAITGAYPIRVLIYHTHQDAAHTCLSAYSINYYPSCPLFLARLHVGMMFPRIFFKLFVYVYRDICFTCLVSPSPKSHKIHFIFCSSSKHQKFTVSIMPAAILHDCIHLKKVCRL